MSLENKGGKSGKGNHVTGWFLTFHQCSGDRWQRLGALSSFILAFSNLLMAQADSILQRLSNNTSMLAKVYEPRDGFESE